MSTLLPFHRPLAVSISGWIKETLASSKRAKKTPKIHVGTAAVTWPQSWSEIAQE